MFATTLQGFILGLIPIGAQNAVVLSRGIHRNHHKLSATLCRFCDLILIGIALLTWGGVLFLSWFGVRSLRRVWRGSQIGLADLPQQMGAKSVLAMTLGVTLL